MSKAFKILVHHSEEDHVFIAEVPDLPGCLAHGETPEEAVASSREAIDLYVEDLEASGEVVPTPRDYRLFDAQRPSG